MPASVSLTVTIGPLKGREFTYAERTTCIVGRAQDCSPQLSDNEHATVSRHHCILDINPPDIRVRDFGSLNGTYVNKVKIGQRRVHQTPEQAAAEVFPEHDLSDGDELRVGGTVFRVSVHVPARCVACHAEIADDEPWDAAGRCAACRATAIRTDLAPAVRAATPKRCAACRRPIPDRADPLTDLCVVCRAEPDKVIEHLLTRARSGGPELAALRHCTLVRTLGRGGMGAVFLIRDDAANQLLALKLMLTQADHRTDGRARFLREAALGKVIRHSRIVTVHHVGAACEVFFFTLEYCPGGSLADLVARRGGRLPVDEALPIALQALDGLDHAHRHGLVHRDLTPHNILLTAGDSPVAKVGDFGLAKLFDLAGLSGLTRTGAAAGKPRFVPRQQVVNFKYAQPDVDVWALAACLYWSLTGASPRDFPAGKDAWLHVLQSDPVPIRDRDRTVPARLATVTDQALRDRPTIGFPTAIELRDALADAL